MTLLEELRAVCVTDCMNRPLTLDDREGTRHASIQHLDSKRGLDHMTYGATWLWPHGTQDLLEGNATRGRRRRAAAVALAIPNLTNIYFPFTLVLTSPVYFTNHYTKPHSDAAVREHAVTKTLRAVARCMDRIPVSKLAKGATSMGDSTSLADLQSLSLQLRQGLSHVQRQLTAAGPRLRDSASIRGALVGANRAADAWDKKLGRVAAKRRKYVQHAAGIDRNGYAPLDPR